MPPGPALRIDPALGASLAFGLDAPPSARTSQLATYIADVTGPAALALIHYGSHAQHSDARPESAHDFFIIVERYADAYRSLAARSPTSHRARTATLLNHILPPNVIRLTLPGATPVLEGKCAVYSLADFRAACTLDARDHFALGRLFQHVQLVWTRDMASRDSVLDAIVDARAATFGWGRCYLPAHFDVDAYCRVLLETSFAAEIRPEGHERIDVLLAAQRKTMSRVYEDLLNWLTTNSIVARAGKVYTDRDPPGRWVKFRWGLHFRLSKARATLRWSKYIVLYAGWLDYIVQKVARRSGVSVQLTDRERRWPLVFLWPKLVRYLRSRPQRKP